MCVRLFVVAAVLLPAIQVAAAEIAAPSFTSAPSATRAGDGWKIAFTISKPADVEVAVLDSAGKVVRHLAAGVLGGPNPPPEPLNQGLVQAFPWDGKDDASQKASGGPFKVRVRLGLQPQFETFLLEHPSATGAVTALAVGPGGQLYMWHRDNTANSNQGANKLKIIDRDGKYVRTLMPFPADLPPEKAKVLGAFADADGRLVPRIYNLQQLSIYYEALGQRGRPMSDSCSPTVDAQGRAYWIVNGGRLEAVDADGSSPYATFLSEPLFDGVKFIRGQPALCTGSDGKTIYVSGIGSADDQWGTNTRWLPCVWRVDPATRKAEVFLGEAKSPGTEKDRFTTPRGLAAAKGLLYVADPGADRIAVFKESDRSLVGELKTKSPQSIGVDPASGAVYVCAYTGKGTAELLKFDGFKTAVEVSRITLPKTFESGPQRIAIDASAQPVRIWLPTMGWQSREVYCFKDQGGKIEAAGDPRDLKAPWMRGELYVKSGVQSYWRVDTKSNKVLAELKLHQVAGNLDSSGTQLVAAPDGSLVALSWGNGLHRLDRDGKPLNWPGQAKSTIPYGGIMTFMQRYLAVPSVDEMFIILPPNYRKPEKDKEGHGKYTSVNVIGPDGATKRTVVWQCSAGAALRLDRKGNVYVADMLKPADRSYPEFFDDKFGKKFVHGGSNIGGQKFADDPEQMSRFWESSMYGSIVKFPPSGGIIWYEKELPACVEGQPPAELLAKPRTTFGRHIGYDFKPVDVQGAEWVRFGFSPWAEPRGAGFCMCEGVGFDVDDYGRVFYPNLGQFRIEIVDTNNNWIGSFGAYGNQDSGGKEARVKKPEVPLAWPTYVAVDDASAFVNDTLSNRVVKVKLGAAAEATCDAK